MLGNIREKLSRLPLRGVLLFFVTILFVGYYRRGWVVALWVLAWSAFVTIKLAFAVKQKVDRQSRINN
jgi:hypothetical protein